MTNHFYIHIPFCNQKCPYCKFALTPVFDEFKKRRYIEYLKKEIREYFDGSQGMNLGGLGRETVGVGGKEIIGGAERTSFSLPNVFDTFGSKSMEEWTLKQRDSYGMTKRKEIDLSSSTDIPSTRDRDNKKYIKTIYFGGGTPSILSHSEIREILECFKIPLTPFIKGESKQKNEKLEITLESNPEDINQEYVEGLMKLGINRLSMGIQTFNDKSLNEIHRSDSKSIISALEGIGEALLNSENISVNIDFILGLPYTLPGEILESIKTLHKQFPFITHTSVYMLEDDNYPKHWKSNSISENEMQAEFIAIMDYFQSIGWNHYELSNFAKSGYESFHNRAYWDHSNSRGFGLSAASYEDGTRWNNASSFGKYYEGKVENEEILTSEQIDIENMMFGLRTSGFDIQNTELNISAKKIQENREKGFLEIEKNMIKPTKTGIFLLDHIMSELIDS